VNRACEVCGARVTNMNPRTTTCDPICTRAKKAHRTRSQQIHHEESLPYPEHDATGCQVCGCRWCICQDR
jgi:hypothetical protein